VAAGFLKQGGKLNAQVKENLVVHRISNCTVQVFNGAIHMGIKRDQFIQRLDRLLHRKEPDSAAKAKALRLTAQYLKMPPEDIVAESIVAWIEECPQAASVKLLTAFGFTIEAARAAWCELHLIELPGIIGAMESCPGEQRND